MNQFAKEPSCYW